MLSIKYNKSYPAPVGVEAGADFPFPLYFPWIFFSEKLPAFPIF